MVAAQRLAAPTVTLLFEPSRPPESAHPQTVQGWRKGWITDGSGLRFWGWVRDRGDDAWGAAVQEIIVRYAIGGEDRGVLASEYPISERQIQAYLSSKAWRSYSQPVMDAITRLGLTMTRKNRQRRHAQIARAMVERAALICALLADDERPEAREIVDELTVLAYAHRAASPEAAS